MSIILSPYLPFPPIVWWGKAAVAEKVILDNSDTFRKATARNRYRIATANGMLQLTVPVAGGRGQRSAMCDIQIDNSVAWQDQHWRSIFSAYGRAPYFEYFGDSLEAIYRKRYIYLVDFCNDSIEWLQGVTGLVIRMEKAITTEKVAGGDIWDWRHEHSRELADNNVALPHYTQVFGDRHGFMPNLSLLDAVMNEGKQVKTLLTILT